MLLEPITAGTHTGLYGKAWLAAIVCNLRPWTVAGNMEPDSPGASQETIGRIQLKIAEVMGIHRDLTSPVSWSAIQWLGTCRRGRFTKNPLYQLSTTTFVRANLNQLSSRRHLRGELVEAPSGKGTILVTTVIISDLMRSSQAKGLHVLQPLEISMENHPAPCPFALGIS